MDFAFFVVNFQYSKADYEQLTATEKVFIYKAWENKVVTESTILSNAVFNAVSNAFRKKGKKYTPLWPKKNTLSEEKREDNIRLMDEIKQKSDTNWIKKMRENNPVKEEVDHGRLYSKR